MMGKGRIQILLANGTARNMPKIRSKRKQRLRHIKVIEELQKEITMLQIYNDKLNGENVSGLSYTELAALESVLQQGICSVDEQIEKAQDELYVKQIVECEIMGDKNTEWIDKNDREDFIYQGVLAKRRTTLRHKARELRLSSRGSQQEHHPDPKVLESLIEAFTVEKERVRIWNQRMIGKELDGMSFHELMLFKIEIQNGLFKVMEEKLRTTKGTRQSNEVESV